MKIWAQPTLRHSLEPTAAKCTGALPLKLVRFFLAILSLAVLTQEVSANANSGEASPDQKALSAREIANAPADKIAAANLRVKVTGVRSGDGNLALAIFHADQSDAFPKDPKVAVASKLVSATAGESVVEFKDLSPGKYAVSLLHDENRDGKMNFSFVGMPKEGFGFSQNPKIYFGAPDFGKCAFEISVPVTDVQVTTKYY